MKTEVATYSGPHRSPNRSNSSNLAPAEFLDLSFVVITLNEEDNIARCLSSIPVGAEIIILDSGSEDGTLKIAENFGAQIFKRPFTNYAEQKNAAISLASRSWIFSLDADEELSPSLRSILAEQFKQGKALAVGAYRVKRRLIFLGRAMRFGKTVDRPVRLFKKNEGRFSGEIHEQLKVDGKIQNIKGGEIFHYSYRDLHDYFERFNRYTTLIAVQHFKTRRPVPFRFFHILRPWAEFLSRYVLRLGFLDGYAGYTYAMTSSVYTFIKYAKLKELYRAERP